jgi:hypothetical protein
MISRMEHNKRLDTDGLKNAPAGQARRYVKEKYKYGYSDSNKNRWVLQPGVSGFSRYVLENLQVA